MMVLVEGFQRWYAAAKRIILVLFKTKKNTEKTKTYFNRRYAKMTSVRVTNENPAFSFDTTLAGTAISHKSVAVSSQRR
jgi:hypothetical protein